MDLNAGLHLYSSSKKSKIEVEIFNVLFMPDFEKCKKTPTANKSGGGSVKEVVIPPIRSGRIGHWLQLPIPSRDRSYSFISWPLC